MHTLLVQRGVEEDIRARLLLRGVALALQLAGLVRFLVVLAELADLVYWLEHAQFAAARALARDLLVPRRLALLFDLRADVVLQILEPFVLRGLRGVMLAEQREDVRSC